MRKSRQRSDDFGDNGFEAWGGYMAAKKAKLQEQFSEEANNEGNKQETTSIFKGISIFVNGYTVPSADELKRIMMVNGGQYHHYYSCEKTSFIIASNLADTKVKQLRGQPKVVKPDWISKCIETGKLVDYRPFLLYSNQSKSQPKISFPASESFLPNFNEINRQEKHKSVQIESKKENGKFMSEKTRFVPLEVRSTTERILQETLKLSVQKLPEVNMKSPNFVGRHEDDSEYGIIVKQEEFQKNKANIEIDEYNPESVTCNMVPDNANDNSVEEKNHEVENTSNTKETLESDHIENQILPSLSKDAENLRQGQKMAKAGEPNFLSEFYSHSRLHHISTMGSMFKKYVSDLRKNHDGTFSGRKELISWIGKQNINTEQSWQLESNDKIIMHIDMDCFFVSVGLRNRPDLQGLPVAVTHARGNLQPNRQGQSRAAEFEAYKERLENKLIKNKQIEQTSKDVMKDRMKWSADDNGSMSEIASCSYEARKAGLKNGMFLGSALKMCPNLKTIPYDFEGYKEVSFILYNTVASYTLDIEAVSCDEMFVDCTNLLRETNTTPLVFASYLREEIKQKTGCPASTGFGGNILQSRLATKKAKPDGQFHLVSQDVDLFMRDIKVEDLPGVGRNLAYRLRSQHLLTCGDLQEIPLSQLQSELGHKTGLSLHQHCRGLDDRSLDLEHTRKSVSAEINYGIRFTQDNEACAFIRELAVEVQSRLEEISKQGRCITLKIMVKAKNAPSETAKFMGHGVCDSMSRSSTLAIPTSDNSVISREAIVLLGQLAIPASSLRGMGIQLSKLTDKSSKDGNLNNFIIRSKKVNTDKDPSCSFITELEPTNSTLKMPNVDASGCRLLKNHTIVSSDGAGSSTTAYNTEVVSHASGSSLDQFASPSTSNSFHNLDPEFLAALPADIRAEVILDYKQNKQANTQQSNLTETSTSSLQAADSITYSQIDPSFLEALPEDLRAEVICDLKQNNRACSPPPKKASDQSPVKLNFASPRKNQSSPRSKHKQALLLKGQQKIDSLLKSPVKGKEMIEAEVTTTVNSLPVSCIPIDVSEADDENSGILNPKIPLTEALQLVREWVDVESLPQDIDRDLMSEFLQQLVRLRRIDKVEALLRTMHRKVEGKNDDWKKIYFHIVAQVQLTMMQEYKAELKVQQTF